MRYHPLYSTPVSFVRYSCSFPIIRTSLTLWILSYSIGFVTFAAFNSSVCICANFQTLRTSECSWHSLCLCLYQTSSKRPHFYHLFQSTLADALLWQRAYYAIHITASQFLDKPRDASASVARSCNCEFAAISRYILETVQASTKVTMDCECEVLCDLLDGFICNDLERSLSRVSRSRYFSKWNIKNGAF